MIRLVTPADAAHVRHGTTVDSLERIAGSDAVRAHLSDGTTVEIEADAVEQWAREIAARNGFTQPQHVVDVFGLCAECSR